MTLLAGFDSVLEISRETLTNLIKSINIGTVSAVPPFEFGLSFSQQGVTGSMHVIITDLTLVLNSDDSITLELTFGNTYGTSVTITSSPTNVTISNLTGNFKVKLLPGWTPNSGPQRQLSFTAAAGANTLSFSQNSINKLSPHVNVTLLKSALVQAFSQKIQNVNWVAGLPPFNFASPGSNGNPQGPIYVSLDPHCIEPESLGLFGMFFANRPKGNHNNKTSTAITSGNDISVSFSPDVVIDFMITPALGSAASELDTISFTFGNGQINVAGSVSDSGPCFEVEGTISGSVAMTIASCTSISSQVHFDEPDIDVDIDWYCGPAGLYTGWIGTTVNITITNALESALEDIAKDSLDSIGPIQVPFGGLPGGCFTQVSITPEGLTINATLNVVLPPAASKGAKLDGSIITTSNTQVGSGTFTFISLCGPYVGPYFDYAQVQTAKYNVLPTLLGQPLQIDWYVRGNNGNVKLQGDEGQVSLECTAKDPFPPPYGTTIPDEQVVISFKKHPELLGIDLTNNPEDLNYFFVLRAIVKDSRNNVVTAEADIGFEGHRLEMPGFGEFMENCSQFWGDFFHKNRPLDKDVRPEELVDYPNPEAIAASISRIVESGIPESRDILMAMKMKWGMSFEKAMNILNASKQFLPTHDARI